MLHTKTNGLTDRQSLRNFDLSFGFKGLTYKTRVYSVDTPSHVYILHINLYDNERNVNISFKFRSFLNVFYISDWSLYRT
jgi:hypothetical protein